MVPVAKSPKLGMEWNVLRCGYILGTRGGNGGRINKTLRFCRRCIDVVFILSSLMSTCELDRFVIQTPYIKVLKSCSALRLWTGRVSTTTTRTSDDGQTYGMDRPTDRRNERERRWINVKPVSSFALLDPCHACQSIYADSSPAPFCPCIFKTAYVSCIRNTFPSHFHERGKEMNFFFFFLRKKKDSYN